MKKICFFLFVLIIFPNFVMAKDLVLKELTILNGEISPTFEPLNNSYTIILDKDVYDVEFKYQVDKDLNVEVINNFDLENNSVVTISLKDEKYEVLYNFQILKEEEEKINTTFLENNNTTSNNNFMFEYKNYIIPLICLLLIIFVNRILFHKKKKTKHKK